MRALPAAGTPTAGAPPPHTLCLFLSSSAADCLGLRGWQRYINLRISGSGGGLPTWPSKGLLCGGRFLQVLLRASSGRKAPASWPHVPASQLPCTSVTVWRAWHCRQFLPLTLQVPSLLKPGTTCACQGPVSSPSGSQRSRARFALHPFLLEAIRRLLIFGLHRPFLPVCAWPTTG